jgi:hypothetical protein
MYPSPNPLPCFERKGAKSLNICGFIPLLATALPFIHIAFESVNKVKILRFAEGAGT